MTSTDGVGRVQVFDTTLRDGEQAPGFSMGVKEKLAMAAMLRDMGVDVMEAGFAAASPGDEAAVKRIAEEIHGPTICSLSRAFEEDIRAAARALAPAKRSRIHIFLATSPVHREAKLRMTREQVFEQAKWSVAFAKKFFDEVEFSPEDAIRTERDFLVEIVQAVIEAGADVVNVPDTVGYTTPDEIYDLFMHLRAQVPALDTVVLSAHCHDDLGMAVANSLAAIRAGARQVECTINGIGERAGNCSLEEIVMALKTRRDRFALDTAIDTTKLVPASRMLAKLTGTAVARNKAIVGRNAFAHEAGIHQHGVLSARETYEIMKPEDVGLPSNSLVLGKHSGKHAILDRAKAMGFELGDNQIKSVFQAFKVLADECGEVSDQQLSALIQGTEDTKCTGWRLAQLEVRSAYGDTAAPFALIELDHPETGRATGMATGDGPLNAAFKAVSRVTAFDPVVEDMEITRVGLNGDAVCVAEIHLVWQETRVTGRARNKDMVSAGVEAYLDAVNQLAAPLAAHTETAPQTEHQTHAHAAA